MPKPENISNIRSILPSLPRTSYMYIDGRTHEDKYIGRGQMVLAVLTKVRNIINDSTGTSSTRSHLPLPPVLGVPRVLNSQKSDDSEYRKYQIPNNSEYPDYLIPNMLNNTEDPEYQIPEISKVSDYPEDQFLKSSNDLEVPIVPNSRPFLNDSTLLELCFQHLPALGLPGCSSDGQGRREKCG